MTKKNKLSIAEELALISGDPDEIPLTTIMGNSTPNPASSYNAIREHRDGIRPKGQAGGSAGFSLSELRDMSIRAGWHPRDEAEQLEADIQDEMYRLRREARTKRITKEAKKRIRKEGK